MGRVLFFDSPGLALGEQLAEIGGLAVDQLRALGHDFAFEGRTRIVVDHAQRHRERAERHFHQHVGKAAVLDIVHHDAGCLPVAIDDIDDFQLQRLAIQRDTLGAL